MSTELDIVFENIKKGNTSILGYPLSMDYDFSELYKFFKYSINNVGDPFEKNTSQIQTHKLEQDIIDFFAKLFRADPENYWGYVTNGGSESNLYGLYLARELYPSAMVYYSEHTHYSVKKNIHLLNLPSITIRSQENGEIDYSDLKHTLQFNRHRPAIILSNFGTTMTEAKDDVSKIKQILKDLAIHDSYIHCDAALAGCYGNFITPRIPFDIKDGADSISISGHKFIGCPFPSGIVLTKKTLRDRISRSIAYIGASDTTITGSRNGHSCIFLWHRLKTLGFEGLKERYLTALNTAEYCKTALQKIGIPAWSNPNAITVVFPKPIKAIRDKWQIATDENNNSHIICMPGVSIQQIDNIIEDIAYSKTYGYIQESINNSEVMV